IRTPVIEVPGFEAADGIATLVDRALAADQDVVIVTGDKDRLQLVGPRVRVLSVLGRTGERIVYDEAKVRERWGVEPPQIADVLALMGDAIDNIPGVHGVGEKTAVKLVSQFGGVDRLYENLSLVAGKLREALAAAAALAHSLAKAPPASALVVEWAGEHRPPSPRIDAVGLFHADVGAAWMAAEAAPLDLGDRPLVIHDAKPLIEWWLERGV